MKIKQSKTTELNRSEINFAAYNPRKHSEKVVASLKKNFRKHGFMGGIIVNKTSGNIVSGHKRVETMDLMQKYDGTKATDYILKVEIVELDDKAEKEQNIYMNNKSVQGDFDYQALAKMSDEISFDAAGLTEFDIDKIAVFKPPTDAIEVIKKEPEKIEKTAEEKAENKEKIQAIRKQIVRDKLARHDDAASAHLTLVFSDYANKVAFMETIGLDIDSKMVSGEDFAGKINLFD